MTSEITITRDTMKVPYHGWIGNPWDACAQVYSVGKKRRVGSTETEAKQHWPENPVGRRTYQITKSIELIVYSS